MRDEDGGCCCCGGVWSLVVDCAAGCCCWVVFDWAILSLCVCVCVCVYDMPLVSRWMGVDMYAIVSSLETSADACRDGFYTRCGRT
jgi:hypothetical protein